jgi:epoxyqueuosine reductase
VTRENDRGGSSRIRSILGDFFAARPRVLAWGAVRLDAPTPNADNLRSWVGDGLHAGLRFMEENLDKRADPRALFPWAKTAVLFALRQPVPFGTDTGAFRVAAYALGNDYHRAARRILDDVEARLAEEFVVRDEHDEKDEGAAPPDASSLRFSGFCDSWPVFERDLAAEAGLGWRGKNSTLLSREHGSGFLLAGFFLSADLNEGGHDRVVSRDFCGSCTACLDACPTDAFVAPGRLDAGKCISYWTIEHKGEIPGELSAKFGDRIFGCDSCQDVCPWNKKAVARADSTALPAPALPDGLPRAPEEWLTLLRKYGGFRARFRKTPLDRAGRKSLLRNVLIAMQNTGTPVSDEWREILRAEEDDPAVRALVEPMP